ncbi:hypothetical protein JHW43_008596 [Diplocarpon mali]|nr:hypothetical protein JHW43_008596 [Diplocarpon mali]
MKRRPTVIGAAAPGTPGTRLVSRLALLTTLTPFLHLDL